MKDRVCKWFSVCPMKRFFEKGQLEEKWIKNFCYQKGQNCIRYKMEEDGKYHPDNMLPDGTIDQSLNQIGKDDN